MRSQNGRPKSATRLRRVAWSKAACPVPEVDDPGPQRLETIARTIAARAPLVLRTEVHVTYTPPAKDECEALARSHQVWECVIDGDMCWCALDADGQRTLLEWVLAGPGSAAPTAVERTIVDECLDRLLASSPRVKWIKSGVERAPRACAWRSDVEMRGRAGVSATLRLFTIGAAGAVRPQTTLRLDDVPLLLQASLKPVRATLGCLGGWQPGTLVRLGGTATDLEAHLRLEHGPVAFGVLGAAGAKRAVRLNGSAAVGRR